MAGGAADDQRLQHPQLLDLRYGDLLFSYFEYVGDDYDADMAKMAADPATQKWWSVQEPLQTRLPGTPEEEQWLPIAEVFHHD